ncbi:MAG TPA: VOC family protein, partial [Caballeronia sp.]|nr:VOC family protein [Caballeronia sp.]
GASEHFYRDVLGFSAQRKGDNVVVVFGDVTLILEPAPPVERAKLALGFRIAAASLDELAARVRAGGGHILAGPAPREHAGTALLLMDPDHYQLEIFSE